MAFISEIIGRNVTDVDGETIGSIKEVLAIQKGAQPHPCIHAIIVKRGGKEISVPIEDVAVLIAPVVPLNKRVKEIVSHPVEGHEVRLVRDVLDKQIIDTNGIRVVRVNDLEISRVENSFLISNVDISSAGLLRRMGFKNLARKVMTRKGTKSLGLISWDGVELLGSNEPMRLKVASDKLSEIHPADLADLISDLSLADGDKLLESLDLETLADTLEEVEPDFQARLIERMPDKKAADVLEEMSPDEAADLLAEIPEDRSRELLDLMGKDEAEDVRELLSYEEDTAGGIMTTEYITVSSDLTAAQAIDHLRKTASEAETIYYIYVTNEDEQIEGVFSLRELVLSDPNRSVSDFMETRVISVKLNDTQDDCAQVVSKYNLLAVPVVDDAGAMHGIVTAADALDKIIPTSWKKRLPKMYY